MTEALAHLVVALNAVANALGRTLLAPVAVLPGWLSATVVAAATGVLLLFVFKHTSNQRAIKRARDQIKANLLAIKLFKDSPRVALRAQGRILLGAARLLGLSLVPMAVMAGPVMLVLGQLALWYQARPLRVGEEAVLSVNFAGSREAPLPDVRLEPTPALDVTLGPVRARGRRLVCWNVQARQPGYHRVVFRVGGQTVEKQLAVGDGFMRVSPRRPERRWNDALLNPAEPPFAADSPVRSIDLDYPSRASWTSGTDSWLVYWFAVSMVAGLCFRRAFNVNM